MAHERETWLDHGVAELLLRGRQVETADMHAQAQADRLARVLEEIAYAAYAGRAAGGNAGAGKDSAAGACQAGTSDELPGEAAALAAYRQAVGTTGRTVPSGRSAADAGTDGIGTVRLGPERGGDRIPRFGRPLRLGLAAAMAGCALSGVAAGAGYLYAPSAGEGRPQPTNSVSDVGTPEPLASESPSDSSPPATPDDLPGGTGTGSVVPGASGSASGTETSGGPAHKREGEKGQVPSDGGWKNGDGEKWYAKLVQACHEYRNGTITIGKKKFLESAAKGPLGVSRFCEQLLNDGPDDDGHYEGAPGSGSGGGNGPQIGGPSEGGPSHGGGTGGGGHGGNGGHGGSGGNGGSGGGTGGSPAPPSGWPGGEYGETIGMPLPDADDAADDTSLPPLLPALPGGGTASDTAPDPATDTGSETGSGAGTDGDSDAGADTDTGADGPGGAPTPAPESDPASTPGPGLTAP